MSRVGEEAVAKACANVALVKYWGKRDAAANLPAVGSISLTLAGLEAVARVGPAGGSRFLSRGQAIGGRAGERMVAFLDWLSGEYGTGAELGAEIEANFPVAAGLASSAAIYCAVATAALSSIGARVGRRELSAVARRGSGSAARSVFGGLVEWHLGTRDDGADSDAEQLLGPDEWDIGMAVAVLDEEQKKTSSRDAMQHVAETSPLYAAWTGSQDPDLVAMRAAIAARDLASVGRITEENTLRMHAVTLAARPPVIYWKPETLCVMHDVHAMREEGIPAWFTMDAGPQVKVLTSGAELRRVRDRLAALPGVVRVLEARPGGGVMMVQGEAPWR